VSKHAAPPRHKPFRAYLVPAGAAGVAAAALSMPLSSQLASANSLGTRGPDGLGRYVCTTAQLSFDACDPDTLGQVESYPHYDGHGPSEDSTASTTVSTSGGVYVVQSGDTLGSIATQFGVSISAIVSANDIANPHWIYPGQHLTIDGEKSAGTHASGETSSVQHGGQHRDSGAPLGERLVEQARKFVAADTPYEWGQESLSGADCSGLVYDALGHLGIDAPRTAAEQQNWVTPISASEARPGDLVFWGDPAHHVGVFIGNDKMIDESVPGTTAHVQSLYGHPMFGRLP
jgi:cell wall-associated NlpC family hydrolase